MSSQIMKSIEASSRCRLNELQRQQQRHSGEGAHGNSIKRDLVVGRADGGFSGHGAGGGNGHGGSPPLMTLLATQPSWSPSCKPAGRSPSRDCCGDDGGSGSCCSSGGWGDELGGDCSFGGGGGRSGGLSGDGGCSRGWDVNGGAGGGALLAAAVSSPAATAAADAITVTSSEPSRCPTSGSVVASLRPSRLRSVSFRTEAEAEANWDCDL